MAAGGRSHRHRMCSLRSLRLCDPCDDPSRRSLSSPVQQILVPGDVIRRHLAKAMQPETASFVQHPQLHALCIAIEPQVALAHRPRTLDGPRQKGGRNALSLERPRDHQAMDERGVALLDVRPEQRILELESDRAGDRPVDLRHEELAVRDLPRDARRIELALVPHDNAQRINPLRGFPEEVFHFPRLLRTCRPHRDGHRGIAASAASACCLLACRPSMTNSTTADQTSAKPTNCAREKPSRKTRMPIRNWIVGEMYCRMPTMDSGTRWTAAANRASGIIVSRPVPISRRSVAAPVRRNRPLPLLCSTTR